LEMAKVTSKGQITIPVSIRRRLSISEGDKLLFIDRPDGVMMVNPDLLGSAQKADIIKKAETKTKVPKVTVSSAKSTKKPNATTDSQDIKDEPEAKTSSGVKVGNLDLDSILEEIRSIGLNL